MSDELHGTAAAPGVASGTPWIHRPSGGDARAGVTIAEAAAAASGEIGQLATSLRDRERPDEAEILEAQQLMAQDPELTDAAQALVATGIDPVEAILRVGSEVAETFAALDDETLSARAADVRDVAQRIARHLSGGPAPRLVRISIVVADDLAPSITVELDRDFLAGIVLEQGSRTSHAAILARSLGIPAVVGVAGIIDRAQRAEMIGLDGSAGLVMIDPDAQQLARIAAASAAADSDRTEMLAYRDRQLATSDGHRVLCAANIGEPAEAGPAFDAGAQAIGLFRTEFAFAGRTTPPSEADQADAYRRVLDSAGDRPVVFRLADIGGDKPLPYVRIPPESNPFLGVRAIRLADTHPDLFAVQLRAILRASAVTGRQVSIMAPMVADADDVDRVRTLVEDARAEIADAPMPRVGIMVEIPSAVLLADELAARVDFMSIGTNDLTQYLLAADRTNPALAERQDPLHPAVLRAVGQVVAGARDGGTGCEIAVCGEMAGDPIGAQLLVGLGVDELSMAPASMNAVKHAVAERSRSDLRARAVQALALTSARDVREMMEA